jgi:hypothetical protein
MSKPSRGIAVSSDSAPRNPELLGRVVLDAERREALSVRDRLGVQAVHHDVVELVEPACVVEVAVRGNDGDRSFPQVRELRPERGEPQPRVHEQVAVAPSDQEQVGLQEEVDVWLADQDDALVDLAMLEPALGDLHASPPV